MPCPSSSRPQPLLAPDPSQVPSTPPRAEAGRRPGERSTVNHSPTCRMQGGAQPAGKSCLGFSYHVSPQALTGVSRETECPPPCLDTGLRLLGWEAGLCDPASVTESFCPLAEEGSLVPETHWGSTAKKRTGQSPPSRTCLLPLGPGRAAGSVIQSSEERPLLPHDLGDTHFSCPPWECYPET